MAESMEQEPIEVSALPFSKPRRGSDAVLIVEDKELHVHIQTLSQASPVFGIMFIGDFVEGNTKRATLEGKSYESVTAMLRLIYSNIEWHLEWKCEQPNILDELLDLSKEYIMGPLEERVKEEISRHSKAIQETSKDEYMADLLSYTEDSASPETRYERIMDILWVRWKYES